jgi:hypothetical protein
MTENEQATDSAEQVTETLKQLQRQLLDLALEIVNEMEEAIADAPLNQQVAALKAILDSVLKLEARMPRDEKEGGVVRIVYQDPDGSVHQSPPWTRRHPRGDGTVSGGSVWETIRKNRIGEDSDS